MDFGYEWAVITTGNPDSMLAVIIDFKLKDNIWKFTSYVF